jgi:hypothetical protein
MPQLKSLLLEGAGKLDRRSIVRYRSFALRMAHSVQRPAINSSSCNPIVLPTEVSDRLQFCRDLELKAVTTNVGKVFRRVASG